MEGSPMTRHGWFRLDGVQGGDRTVDEQMRGLQPALEACKDKSVLDLGCAEGLIAREFARAGAVVVGIELLADHCAVARRVCKGLPVEIIQSELKAHIDSNPEPVKFDIVLALGIAHKLHDPGSCIAFAAKSAKELVVFRGPGKKGMYWDGTLKAKFGSGQCHVPTIFKEAGFREGETLDSAHGERAQYWWRSSPQV